MTIDIAKLVPAKNDLCRYAGVRPVDGQFGDVALTWQQIEQAYAAGFCGAFCDSDESPTWARRIARYQDRQAAAEGIAQFAAVFPAAFAGAGSGKRAIYWNYARRLHPEALGGQQITGNCVEASNGWTTLTMLLATAIYLLGKPFQFEALGSTLFYAFRGHCGQGMNLGTAAAAHAKYGWAVRRRYGDVDLTDIRADQEFSMQHCRDPETRLREILAETSRTPIGRTSRFDGGREGAMDVLYCGGVLHTGSSYTAAKNGDPISSLARIGAHAQSCIGYDDTDEFREWYRRTTDQAVTEPVFLFDQNWGPVRYVQKNWPPFWGAQPEGVFVLPWSLARRLIESTCYAYYPDLTGVAPADLQFGG